MVKFFFQWHFLQVVVIIITLAMFGVNLYGTTQLEQYFDQNWVLPPDSMTYKYTHANSEVNFLHLSSLLGCLFLFDMSICLCLFVCLSFCLAVCLSACLSPCLLVCLSICLSVWLAGWLPGCLSVWLSVSFTLTFNAPCKLFSKNFAEARTRLGSCNDNCDYFCNVAVFPGTWGPSGNIHRWDKR